MTKNAEGRSRGGSEEFAAGHIRVENGPPPRWLGWVPHVALAWALGYYLYVGVTDPVNLVFASLFVFWAVYTPIARRRGWFHIPM